VSQAGDPPKDKLPAAAQAEGKTSRDVSRFGSFSKAAMAVTSLVAIIPLLVMGVIDYWHDREADVAENRLAVSRTLSTTKRSLEDALDARLSALSLVLACKPYERLARDEDLAAALSSLQDSFGEFVDLGIIDSGGIQRYYAGPYALAGKDYREQAWFDEVRARGRYVSKVFRGYRDFPHLVIALRHKRRNGTGFILRTTLDVSLMKDRIYDLEHDRPTDAFIVDSDGVLQTPSTTFGKVLSETPVKIPPSARTKEVIEERWPVDPQKTFGAIGITGTPFFAVVLRKHKAHFHVWLLERMSMLWFLAGSIGLIILVAVLTAKKMVRSLSEAEDRRAKAFHDLEYTNKLAAIGRMAASVAHEINNPLAIIGENAGLLQDMSTYSEDYPQKEKTLTLIRTIQRSVQRCSDVTHRLLGFAKRMEVRKEPISLDKLLEEVVSFQKTEAELRRIHIESVFPDAAPSIESDRGQLQQVFLNILSNALAAVDDQGRIDIRVTQVNEAHVAVVIADDGKGIPEADLKHVFEPFYSTKGEFGTGLGLSITRDIIHKLGGTIDVQSRVGKGTSFIVTLPVKPPAGPRR